MIDKTLLDALVTATEVFIFELPCPRCRLKGVLRWATDETYDTPYEWYYTYRCTHCLFQADAWNDKTYPYRCTRVHVKG